MKILSKKQKRYADKNNISLSRMIEHLLTKVVEKPYQALEDFPISDWVGIIADGPAEYKTKKSKKIDKSDFFESKK